MPRVETIVKRSGELFKKKKLKLIINGKVKSR